MEITSTCLLARSATPESRQKKSALPVTATRVVSVRQMAGSLAPISIVRVAANSTGAVVLRRVTHAGGTSVDVAYPLASAKFVPSAPSSST